MDLKRTLARHTMYIKTGEEKYRADLSGANLSGADLSGTRTACIQNLGGYFIMVNNDRIKIGCQEHTKEDWECFPTVVIERMANNAIEWWATYKPVVMALHKAVNKGGN